MLLPSSGGLIDGSGGRAAHSAAELILALFYCFSRILSAHPPLKARAEGPLLPIARWSGCIPTLGPL